MRYLELPNSQGHKVEWWLRGGGRNEELLFNGNKVSILQDEKILEVDGGDVCTIM